MKHFFWIVLIVINFTVSAQHKLEKDIDFDGIIDTVFVDHDNATIVCVLSSEKFKKIVSKPIEILNLESAIKDARDGFYFENHWMRAGYSNQFRYDKRLKKIRLIGMSRYEFGNAANDGSGESSVNLLTGDYLGDWNYFDLESNNSEGELIKIPTIKTKMYFDKIYLDNFEEAVYFNYAERCSELYYEHRDKMKNKRK
ncbi:hypothetical protein [Aquimarina algicola]|uniref:Uncharacterized protein n=1 Tax=Aquimarina algicola TaxID=2589995 RepID=A0A504J7J4_9FLAO|nr:hypothetical protein [Aquimarina algicola]TPN86797.1 hypothetical protein FHK87_04120 [Aquimarina algicola]